MGKYELFIFLGKLQIGFYPIHVLIPNSTLALAEIAYGPQEEFWL